MSHVADVWLLSAGLAFALVLIVATLLAMMLSLTKDVIARLEALTRASGDLLGRGLSADRLDRIASTAHRVANSTSAPGSR